MGPDTGQARTDLFGIGKGDAQIFDTNAATEQIMQNRQNQFASAEAGKKRRQAVEDDIYKGIGDLDKIAIYSDHQPDFAKMQGELTDFVRKNIQKLRASDPDTTMEYQKLKTNILTNAELSKNFRENKERVGLEILKNPEAYRDESIDYFTQAGRDETGAMNFDLDTSKIKKDIDLEADIKNVVRPLAEDMAKGKSFTYADSKGNEYSTDINSFGKDQVKVILEDRLKHPEIAEQAATDFGRLPQEEQKKYSGFTDYYVQRMTPYVLVDQNKTVSKAAKDEDGESVIEVSEDEESPMTFKVEKTFTGQKLTPDQQSIVNMTEEEASKLTAEQQRMRKQWAAGDNKAVVDVPMAAKATHVKPVLSNTPMTERMRTIAGDKVPQGVEIRDGEYGQTAVMPFVKSGKNKGNLVHKNELKQMQEEGNVEWTVATTGTLTYGEGAKAKKVSIVRPASEIKSALSKNVNLDELQKIADQKNAQKKKQSASAPKKITKGAVVDGYRFLGGDPKNQKNWEVVK